MHNLVQEIIATQKQLSIQSLANTKIITSVLLLLSQSDVKRIKELLDAQYASDELQGQALESYNLAIQIVSSAIPSPPNAPLRLVHSDKID